MTFLTYLELKGCIMSGLLAELQARGFIAAQTDEKFGEILEQKKFTLYCGFDPTADSLHIGSLLPIMALRHFQKAGHKPIIVMGGGTGMVGDPSGKSSERRLLNNDTLIVNIAGMQKQFEKLLDFDENKPNGAKLVNNADWLNSWHLIDFLRDVGKHFPLSVMLSKDSVKSRLEGESGISFTEFSYQVLQAYDFYHLFSEEKCALQVGGGDQWGNIIAGIDFIKRKLGNDKQAYGLLFPLLTTSSGKKFGKSEDGNVWLDENRTSYFDFYQYFLRSEDADVVKFLKFFTEIPLAEIEEIEKEHFKAPEKRHGQKRLAEEVTKLIHDEKGLSKAIFSTQLFYDNPTEKLTDKELLKEAIGIMGKDIHIYQSTKDIYSENYPIIDALIHTNLASSKRDAKRKIQQGSVYLNNERIENADKIITADDLS